MHPQTALLMPPIKAVLLSYNKPAILHRVASCKKDTEQTGGGQRGYIGAISVSDRQLGASREPLNAV